MDKNKYLMIIFVIILQNHKELLKNIIGNKI